MTIKQIELDIHNGLKNIVNAKNERPTIVVGAQVRVSLQSFLIDLKIDTLISPPTNKHIGIITNLHASKEKYGNLNVGDSILFEEKHILYLF